MDIYEFASGEEKQLTEFLAGKTDLALMLLKYFVEQFNKAGKVKLHPAKTMIGVANENKRVAWVTQLGKDFIHVVFPFKRKYDDNMCFHKIVQVPGNSVQFNHHLRITNLSDINEEVQQFMKLAYNHEK